MTYRCWLCRIFLAIILLSANIYAWRHVGVRVVVNLTPSLPYGVYLVTTYHPLTPGTLILFDPPPDIAYLATFRQYVSPGTPFLKPVGANSGDVICAIDHTLSINGVNLASIRDMDTEQRPLPFWQGCLTLDTDHVFPLSTMHSHSLDGRYFGAIPVTSVHGIAQPLLTWH